MTIVPRTARLAIALGILVALAGAPSAAVAADRPADKILEEIKALKPPTLDPAKRGDREAVVAYLTAMQEVQAKKADLILELYKSAPETPELAKLLPERWSGLLANPTKTDDVLKEIDEVTAATKDEALKVEAAFFKARAALVKNRVHPEAALPAADAFAQAAPDDPRAAQLLYVIASMTRDEGKKAQVEDKILKDFPKSPYVRSIEGTRRQRDAVGKPFELEFTDAITGSSVSMKGLKGKVVVIDFWATWCGPCVAEMPNMKKLYAEYKPKGVEFIGVSLDRSKEQGGLDALKEFVAKNEITWPQYYQGNYWQSDFSSSWGINAIPAVFIVDADGKLASVEARGKLDTLIPELLKKANPTAGAGGE